MFNPSGFAKDMQTPGSDVGETNALYASMTVNESGIDPSSWNAFDAFLLSPDDPTTTAPGTTGTDAAMTALENAAAAAAGKVITAAGNSAATRLNPRPTLSQQLAQTSPMMKLVLAIAIAALIYTVVHHEK